jgi:uncharacterized protein YjbI with pentapeptide repeats
VFPLESSAIRAKGTKNPMTKHWTVLFTASLAAMLALFDPASAVRADIFQWEYINPANPGEGKQQSTTLAPDGAGANAVPAAYLVGSNLTKAYLIGADLSDYWIFGNEETFHYYTDLSGANLSQALLTYANLSGAVLSGANLSGAEVRGATITPDEYYGIGGITLAQLYSTASYQAHDLSGMTLDGSDFAGGNFVGQNLANARLVGRNPVNLTNANLSGANLTNATVGSTLTNANLSYANLTNALFGAGTLAGANLTGAEVRDATFYYSLLSAAQLYSTASYQAHDLSGILLHRIDLTGGNLAGQNLANAYFPEATLTGANLSGADARGASFYLATLTGANTSNLIHTDGHISGLDLIAGASLVVRDYDGNPAVPAIVVDQHLAMDATSTLRLVFDADAWNSTIAFAPGISSALGGTLELTFAPGVDIATQNGRTIDLFDWTGVTPTGAFTVSSPYAWDLTKIYTTGEVTLAALPAIPGDFNGNGAVDAADYVVWRKGMGTQTAYETWRAKFGRTAGGGSAANAKAVVPEPRTPIMFVAALVGCAIANARLCHKLMSR